MSDLSVGQIETLLNAMRAEAMAGPTDAHTAEELGEMMAATGNPIHRKRLLALLDQLWRAGKVEAVKVQRQKATRLARVPAYRFKS